MKKITLLFICLVSVLNISAEVYSGQCGDNANYTLDTTTGTLSITGTGSMTGYSSASSVPWYSEKSSIKTVAIADGITSIGGCAFSGCRSLTSVTIPNSVTSICGFAFRDCSLLSSVTIPNSVTRIEDEAFMYCRGLTSVTIPNSVKSIGNRAFEDCSGLTKVTLNNNTITSKSYSSSSTIGNIFGSQVKEYIIGDDVTSIGSYAFYNCSTIESVTIGNSVTSIGVAAFSGCRSLTSIEIPNSVTSIGNNAFHYCFGLTKVELNSNVIASKSYDSVSSLKNIFGEYVKEYDLGNDVTSIGNYAFQKCSGLTSVNIPNSVKSIGEYAFYNCSGLIVITIPNSVKSIGEYAFAQCSSLTSISIPNSVTSIGGCAFSGCSSLTSITIPNSVTSIEYSTFSGCSDLKYVTIPNSVTSIGHHTFQNCSGITSVTIPDNVTSIGSSAFYGTRLKTLIVGTGMLSFGTDVFSTRPVKTIWLTNTPPQNYNVAQGTINYVANSQYSSLNNKKEYKFLSSMFEVDGVRYVPVSPSERTCDVIDCIYGDSVTEVSINPTVSYKGVNMTVQNVQPYTFYQNPYIKTASFDIDGSIGKYVFSGCNNLQTIVLGQNVTSIGEYSFNGCSKLESIIIPDAVNSIGQYAFSGCTNLKSISLGEGTESIGNSAFSGCSSLSKIVIPGSVNYIYDLAFNGCSGLKIVIMADRNSEGELNLGYNGKNSALFADCPLDSVYIGRNLSYGTIYNLGYSPFYRNTTLRSVTITDKETEISENEFYGCTNLQNVQIGDGVTSIGNWAFSGCSSLKNFSFGTQVKTIGQEAFSDCTAVTAITSNAQTPPTCGTQALDDINKWDCVLYVPKGYVSDYQAADQWKDFFFIEEIQPALRGDVNDDGVVNGTDIQAIINLIVESLYDEKGDVNEDGNVNGTDIQEVINIIVNAE